MKVKKISKGFVGSILVFAIIVTFSGAIYGVPISTLDAGVEGITPDAAFKTTVNSDGNTGITGYDKAQNTNYPVVNIPGTINGKPVISVNGIAFKGEGLTLITIPPIVTSIGMSAFDYNLLTCVKLPYCWSLDFREANTKHSLSFRGR